MRRPRLSVTAVALTAPLLLTGCVGEADDDGGPSTTITEREEDLEDGVSDRNPLQEEDEDE